MLLLDSQTSELTSLPESQLQVAVVPCRAAPAGSVDTHVALRDALGRSGWPLPGQMLSAAALAVEAAQAAEAGGLQVGSPFPDTATIIFDARRPQDGPLGTVGIGNKGVAARLAAWLGANDVAATAVQAAMRNPFGVAAMLRDTARTADVGGDVSASVVEQTLVATGWDSTVVARLLMDQVLLLVPEGASQCVFRLAWRRPLSGGGSVAAAPAPANPVPRPVASPASGPRSVLPDPPATQSAQAATLVNAAQAGTPFCEECAKAAAQQGAPAYG